MIDNSRMSKLPANGFVQPWDGGLLNYWCGDHLDVKLGLRPNGSQFNSFIAIKPRPNGRAEQVRAKFTDDERRRLRVTIFETGFDPR